MTDYLVHYTQHTVSGEVYGSKVVRAESPETAQEVFNDSVKHPIDYVVNGITEGS